MKHSSRRVLIEKDIMAMSMPNMDKWEKVKPAWFTDSWIDKVPSDCIPYKYCVRYRKTKGRNDVRRGSVSIKELVGIGDDTVR